MSGDQRHSGVGRNCYIYGSIHTKKPPRELLECADKVVDYVLVEGVNTKVHLGFRFTLYWLPLLYALLSYFKLLRSICWLQRHQPDMKAISEFFIARGKHVEVADRDLKSVIEFCYQRIKKVQPILTLLWILGWVTTLLLLPTFIVVLIAVLVTPWLYLIMIRESRCIEFRDGVVIAKASELINKYNILIARGEIHIDYIKRALKDLNIVCHDLKEVCK